MNAATEARLEVPAAALRAIAQTPTPEQALLFLRCARAAAPLSGAADEAVSAELAGVSRALASGVELDKFPHVGGDGPPTQSLQLQGTYDSSPP